MTSHEIPHSHMVQMGWDYLVTVGLCSTSHGIPQCHMVQMGWDGQVGLPGNSISVWYIPWDHTVPYATNRMGWTGRITWSL